MNQAAVLLRDTFSVSVEKRYNSNGRSGGAWVITDGDKQGVCSNSSIGITASLKQDGSLGYHVYSEAEHLYEPALAIHKEFRQYAHPQLASVMDAVDWVKTHVRVPTTTTSSLDEDDALIPRAPRPR